METSRVMIHFDDLLSVLNDAQLKSALNAYKEVRQLMKRASEQRKRKMGDRLTVRIRGEMSNLTDWINHRYFFHDLNLVSYLETRATATTFVIPTKSTNNWYK